MFLKLLSLNFCAILLSLVLSGAFSLPLRAETPATSFEKVVNSRTINCGVFVFNNLYNPPMKEGDDPTGFFADVMKEVGLRLRMKVGFAEVPNFGTAYQDLKSNKYDMLCASFGSYAENYDKMLFSEVLFYDPLFAYGDIKRNYDTIKSTEDINQEKWRIAGMEGELGGYYGPIVFPKATMHMLGSLSPIGEIMTDMLSNKADMVLITRAAADAYEKTNPNSLKQLVKRPIAYFPIRFVFKPDDIKLKFMIDQVIEDMKHEGVIDKLMTQNGISIQ